MITLRVRVILLFTGEVIGMDYKLGDIKEDAKPFDNLVLVVCFTASKFLIMISLYAGAVASIYGLLNNEPPKKLHVHLRRRRADTHL